MANKKYRLRGTVAAATERGRREAEALSRILSFLEKVEIEIMADRVDNDRPLKDPITFEEFKAAIARMRENMRVEKLLALTPEEVIERYKDYEPDEPLPPFDEFMKKVEARQAAQKSIKEEECD